MYSYIWDKETGGYRLTNQTGRFVANEIRPVFAPELQITGMGKRFDYDPAETRPLMWAQKNTYLIADVDENGTPYGRKAAQLNNTQYGKKLMPEYFFTGKQKLEPVDVSAMLAVNAPMMEIITADAKRRTKELYDADIESCDIAYIAFSGGKDSAALLDICHRVLPRSVPVIFSDTDMELPDTYKVWEEIQTRYPDREFIKAKAETSALENWRRFGPPSRTIRWCCSVHKSTPALMLLKDRLHKTAIRAMAFVGVRGDESISRSLYEDSAEKGVKNASQLNRMPILDWGAHELWLYIFANDLLINEAYKKGLTRVGCIMCPESSEKYVWFVDRVYPQALKPYNDILIETSNKRFANAAERKEFIGSLSWQARKSGVVLLDTITAPSEEHNGLTVTFQSPFFSETRFYEWIKTLGTVVVERGKEGQRLKLPNTLDDGLLFQFSTSGSDGGQASFTFRDSSEKWTWLPVIKSFLKKVSACIACRSCESECTTGAISVQNGQIVIDNTKCIRCRKCYEIDCSCWRYMSMRIPEKSKSQLVAINNYYNFGLRECTKEGWVSILVEMGCKFFPWDAKHPLGNKKVESARNWFIQSNLIHESDKKPTLLVDLFRKYGGAYPMGWEFVWIALVNNAVLLKWFVASTQIDKPYTSPELSEMLLACNPNLGKSTIEGGLAALRDMLTKSPLGGDGAVTFAEMKGKVVKSLTRKAKEVNPLTILYGLYLIAVKTERSGFTIRELMTADETSAYISPLVAFGIGPDMFKKQCEGLESKYPDYIETTFTHGNDEITIFPGKYTLEDILKLALGD